MLRIPAGTDGNDYAMVLNLHRDDITGCGIPAEVVAKIDDDLLSEIAERLGDVLLETAYWDVLKTLVTECVKMPEDEIGNFQVNGSSGTFEVDKKNGEILAYYESGSDKSGAEEYKDVVRFDIVEYETYHGKSNDCVYVDILDIGYWSKDGKYTSPEADYREKKEVFPVNEKHEEIVIDTNEDFTDEKYEREGGSNEDDE